MPRYQTFNHLTSCAEGCKNGGGACVHYLVINHFKQDICPRKTPNLSAEPRTASDTTLCAVDAGEDSWVQAEEGSDVMSSEQLSDAVMIASSVLSSLGDKVRASPMNPNLIRFSGISLTDSLRISRLLTV